MAGSGHRFSLFGEPTGAAPLSTTSDPASFAYAGGMHNRESKTTKFDWRDLNHKTGRWLTQEPLGAKVDKNFYRYVWNGPLRYTDPTGLYPATNPDEGSGPSQRPSTGYVDVDARVPTPVPYVVVVGSIQFNSDNLCGCVGAGPGSPGLNVNLIPGELSSGAYVSGNAALGYGRATCTNSAGETQHGHSFGFGVGATPQWCACYNN